MKLLTVFAMVVLVQSAFGISAIEEKKDMLTRLDGIIKTVESTKKHAAREETKKACSELQKLLKILPEHRKAISFHMSNKTNVMIARDEVMRQLIFVHRQSTVCKRGHNAEHVDSKDLEEKMKTISKSLKKQKMMILNEQTDSTNEY